MWGKRAYMWGIMDLYVRAYMWIKGLIYGVEAYMWVKGLYVV